MAKYKNYKDKFDALTRALADDEELSVSSAKIVNSFMADDVEAPAAAKKPAMSQKEFNKMTASQKLAFGNTHPNEYRELLKD